MRRLRESQHLSKSAGAARPRASAGLPPLRRVAAPEQIHRRSEAPVVASPGAHHAVAAPEQIHRRCQWTHPGGCWSAKAVAAPEQIHRRREGALGHIDASRREDGVFPRSQRPSKSTGAVRTTWTFCPIRRSHALTQMLRRAAAHLWQPFCGAARRKSHALMATSPEASQHGSFRTQARRRPMAGISSIARALSRGWRMASGEWRVASREWRIANGECCQAQPHPGWTTASSCPT
jgi:hypothetical protein